MIVEMDRFALSYAQFPLFCSCTVHKVSLITQGVWVGKIFISRAQILEA
jgi:hypothetical protein